MTDSDPTTGAEQSPGELSVNVAHTGAEAVVTVRGEIDLETSPELSAVLAGLHASADVDIDLGGVTYIDSTGLRALLAARDAAIEAGGTLRVSATSNIVARLIEITGANELFER